MGVVHLPAGRLHRPVAERSALRQGIASGPAHVHVVKRAEVIDAQPSYCDGCARPIDFGAVFRGTHCSPIAPLDGSTGSMFRLAIRSRAPSQSRAGLPVWQGFG